MSTYIVTFSVDDKDRKEKLRERLKSYGTYCPINANCWAIVSENTPVQIRGNLDAVLDSKDRIFVIRSGTVSAWRNAYSDDNSKWLIQILLLYGLSILR